MTAGSSFANQKGLSSHAPHNHGVQATANWTMCWPVAPRELTEVFHFRSVRTSHLVSGRLCTQDQGKETVVVEERQQNQETDTEKPAGGPGEGQSRSTVSEGESGPE